MYPFIESVIKENLPNSAVSFVFPSEVAAASWPRRALELSGARGIATDRFLGWDTFKTRLFSRKSGNVPADRLVRIRLLWAASALEANARSPFLKSLIREEHRKDFQGYVPFLANILPGLKRIADRADRAPRDPKVRDLAILYERYSAFLRERGLFEPAYESLPAPETDQTYILFCPELAQDYGEYADALSTLSAIRVVNLPDPSESSDPPESAAAPDLLEFPNIHEELRWIFRSVARDLDSRLRPEEIAVTVTDLDAEAPWVTKAASLAGGKAEIRSGLPLAKHPVGRFLAETGTCAQRSFDQESVNALLLDRFLPWKEPDTARGLVRFGMEYHTYAPFHVQGKPRDAWIESFRVCRARVPGLESFYRKLRKGIEELTGAADFRSLANAFVGFRKSFLDESRLSDEDSRSFQRAMDELKGFAREEAALGLPGPVPHPFALFQEALSQKRYVPQSAGTAVPVYAYRVSALLAVKRHYVAGSSQEGLKVNFGDAPGLREDQKEALGYPDRDAAPLYAKAYAVSGSTAFSYAVEALSGWSLPYPWFSKAGHIAPPADYSETRQEDPWTHEARAWSGGPFPEKILAEQAEAARSAAVSLRAPASNYEKALASKDARDAALTSSLEEDGKLRLSATHIEEMRKCPFAWLLARGLALQEEKSGIGFFDARLAGEMAHSALEILYGRIAGSGPFDADRIQEYQSWVDAAVADALPAFEKRHGPFLRPMFEAYVPKLADRIRRLLTAEAARFAGWEVEELEDAMRKDYPEEEVLLVGRLDRVARHEAGGKTEYAIIDYKKRTIPKKSEVYLDKDGNLGSLQMAAYILLCEAAGKAISRASYWSVEDAAALDVLGAEACSRKDYDGALAVFEGHMRETARKLRAGDFRPPQALDRDCANCGWQAVCRVRYATE
jgi:RecB family exonuclease